MQGPVTTFKQESTPPFAFVDGLAAAYVILLPIQVETGVGLRFAPSDLVLLLFLLCYLWRIRIVKDAWSVWHFALLLTFAFGNFVSVWENESLSRYVLLSKDIGLLVLLATYLMIVGYAKDWVRFRRLLRLLVASVVWQNAFALAGFVWVKLSGVPIPWLNYESARVSGMLIDPNAYGGLLVLVFAVHTMAVLGKQPLLSGWRVPFATLSLTAGILLTFSRSAWIGLAMVVVVAAWIRPTFALRFLLTAGAAIGSILLVLGREYLTVIEAMATRGAQVTSRLDFIRISLERFQESPIFGVGLGTFHEQYGWIVHNTPLWFLTEFGLVGLAVFLGFVLWFFAKGAAARRHAKPEVKPLLFGLLLAHLAMLGLSMGIEALYQRHWWLVMGLLAAGASLVSREQRARRAGQPSEIREEPIMEDRWEMRRLLRHLRKQIWLIVLVTVCFTAGAALLSAFWLAPNYEATTEILLNSTTRSTGGDETRLAEREIASNLMLVETYRAVIISPRILETVANRSGQKVEELRKQIAVENLEDSQVISITVQNGDSDAAVKIANQVATVFQQEIPKLMNIDNVNVLTPAKTAEQVWPKPFLIGAVAFFVSLIATVGGVLLRERWDTRLRTEQDIEEYLQLPVLGTVAVIPKCGKERKTPTPKLLLDGSEKQT